MTLATTPTPTQRIDAVWALLISWPIGCSIALLVIAVWFVATRERTEQSQPNRFMKPWTDANRKPGEF